MSKGLNYNSHSPMMIAKELAAHAEVLRCNPTAKRLDRIADLLDGMAVRLGARDVRQRRTAFAYGELRRHIEQFVRERGTATNADFGALAHRLGGDPVSVQNTAAALAQRGTLRRSGRPGKFVYSL